MYEVVSELPEKLRVAIHLHYYEGYSLNEIAKILDIAPSAVSMRLTRAKEGAVSKTLNCFGASRKSGASFSGQCKNGANLGVI